MRNTFLFVMMIVALLISACGGTPAQVPAVKSAEKPAGEGDEPVGSEKITLRLWSHSGSGFQAANDALIAKFMELNPNIEVKYETFEYDLYIQTLQTSMSAGTEADVIEMFGTWVCSYAIGERLLAVPTDIMTVGKAKDIYFAAPLGGYVCNEILYGFPNESNLEVGGALVNPALFAAKNVPFPPQWKTYSDMISDAKKLSEFDSNGAMNVAGYYYTSQDGLPFAMLTGILEQDGNYFAEDGKHFNFDTPEARKIVQLLVDMAQKDKVVDPITFNDKTGSNGVTDLFFNGRVAIGSIGSWSVGEGRVNYPDMIFDYVAVPPYFGSEHKYAADSGWGKVVSSNTKHPQEAWKLAAFIAAEEENALMWNTLSTTIPAMKSLVEHPTILEKVPWLKTTFDLLPYGTYIGDLGDRDKLFYDIIFTHVLSATQGSISVDEAVKTINIEANAMVDAAK